MARLHPGTRSKLASVWKLHREIAGELLGDERTEEQSLLDRIQEAAQLGSKKNIMTEKRIKEMCDAYLNRFGPK